MDRAKFHARFEELESRQLLSTYYVSAWGNDRASGTSQGTAWKSISRVNAQQLRWGDTVLFQGGQKFYGSIQVMSNEGGTNFGSYGGSRATIMSGNSAGVDVGQTANVSVKNLNFIGSGMYNNSANGIWFHANWANRALSGVTIDQVDVQGYGGFDIKLEAPGWGSSYSNVRITNGFLHNSLKGGLWINAYANRVNKNIYVGYIWSWNHPGSGSTGEVTGSGIEVFDSQNAVIERCVSHDNGSNGAAPVGIWTAGSDHVTIQYCESFNNKTKTSTDGGGIDFDWDTTNSTMQYNFTHDNQGPGLLIAAGSHPCNNNTIRYNISQNDARKNSRGAIELWGRLSNTKIYNNTIYVGGGAPGGTSALFAHNYGAWGQNMSNLDVRNNIFYTTNGYEDIKVNDAVTSSGTNRFVGNDYYGGGWGEKINWNGRTFYRLADFQNATGQEKEWGWGTGYQGNPKLNSPGTATRLDNSFYFANLWQYKLRSDSPLVNRGTSVTGTLSAASTDFFGGWLPKGGKYDIGADELR